MYVTFPLVWSAVWHKQGGWEECVSNSRFALSKRRFTVMGLDRTTLIALCQACFS